MQLSRRMTMNVDMLTPAACIADIGTDHGYVPIYLIRNKIADKVIASDVRPGPLSRAREHVAEEGLQDQISLRLGDGLTSLNPGEADSILIAGMGGLLMIRILSESPDITGGVKELVLQPQSDLDLVRKYLHQQGFIIADEDMTIEDGKYYTVLRCMHGEEQVYTPEEYLYGKVLIEKKHSILRQYLLKKIQQYQEILKHLQRQDTVKSHNRSSEIAVQIDLASAALHRIEGSPAL